MKQPVRGTFKLTLTSSDALFDFYDLTDANWVTTVGGSDVRVTGSGTYQVGGEFALQQRLTLDLSIDGAAPIHFDNGLVESGAEFPNIDITISINGVHCYDTVIVINASPAQIIPYTLFDGSTYQKGCFLPCLCAISPELPLVGTFGLVELQQGPLFTEYAVVNIDWTIVFTDGAVPGLGESLPIIGSGIFRIGGEFVSQQQLSVDLTIDDEPPTHFDSGPVIGGGAFPSIDIQASVNGFYCFDEVIHLIAVPE